MFLSQIAVLNVVRAVSVRGCPEERVEWSLWILVPLGVKAKANRWVSSETRDKSLRSF